MLTRYFLYKFVYTVFTIVVASFGLSELLGIELYWAAAIIFILGLLPLGVIFNTIFLLVGLFYIADSQGWIPPGANPFQG